MSAFDYQSLFDKSKVYIGRAIDFDEAGDEESFHLWAALSLELLGKAALANVHPALTADPTDVGSMFAACGKPFSTPRKSILAKTVFERLVDLSKRFLTQEKEFCLEITHRRNAELHSGELPFTGIRRDSWTPKFWRVSEIMLEMQNSTLLGWLGQKRAVRAKEEMRVAETIARVEQAIKQHRNAFNKKFVSIEDKKKARLSDLDAWFGCHNTFAKSEYNSLLQAKCPACKSKAGLAGKEWSAEWTGEYDDPESWMELVKVTYTTVGFHCPVCALHLSGREELDAAKIPDEFVETESRESEFEPDYGND